MTANRLLQNNLIRIKKTDYKKKEKIFNSILKKNLQNINNENNIFHILSKNFKLNFNLKDLKKFKKFQSIVIIGMGGSILGAEAIYEFLKHKVKKKIYFLDDLSEEKIIQIKRNLKIKKTLFLIISKSGNTVETSANLFLFNILKKNAKNIILISEKKNNFLNFLSKKFNLFFIEHKDYIGGRYSVLSEVGAVPTLLMGLSFKKLRSNILKYIRGENLNYLKKSTIQLSYLLKQNKSNNLIFLNYSPKLEKFLFWLQQLIGESLGKKGLGFLPVVSNVPKDHHSLLQLYLDGPKNKVFYIFSLDIKESKKIKTKKIFKDMNFLNYKRLQQIKTAQKKALIQCFKKNKIIFKEISIDKINEKTLGELFSYFIIETIFLGEISRINPFDQPAVEQVKVFTKKSLS